MDKYYQIKAYIQQYYNKLTRNFALQTWADLKKKVKHKSATQKREMGKTGGGAAPPPLNSTDNEILEMISPTLVSGHEDTNESKISFEFEVSKKLFS